MGTITTRDRLIGDGNGNPEAADGGVELEATEPAPKPIPMSDAQEQASHGIAANIARYAYLLLISLGIIVLAAAGWFYFHG